MQSFDEVFKPKWELAEYTNLDDARSFAIAHGWRRNPPEVQIRQVKNMYVIEPFEIDCKCTNIIQPF